MAHLSRLSHFHGRDDKWDGSRCKGPSGLSTYLLRLLGVVTTLLRGPLVVVVLLGGHLELLYKSELDSQGDVSMNPIQEGCDKSIRVEVRFEESQGI